MARIHPTAVVDPRAELADDVEIGPYVVITGEVQLASGCVVGPFCRLEGPAVIAEGNRFTSHCSIGAPPQDLSYKGEPTRLEIGPGNWFREHVTVHRGTVKGGGVTRIGGNGLFMVGAHVAHDCHVGNGVIFANGGTLAGHVEVGDYATIGAFSAVHQFCRVGPYAFLGGFTVATKDCLPFMRTVGARPARCFGPNTVGLERKGFAAERREALKKAWRILRNPKLTTTEAVIQLEAQLGHMGDVQLLISFIRASKRGVVLSRG
ncbi:MAG: acyl-ACP--UDP-N-acetylglucosamine O-acyltransferase [Thermoanaerobaculum sp.]|nr:acyl-ACP--UDP-N-acetylglucosamine O-acyltransferase [Thermoanaerobaculum sp.]MDW7967091.1 acyl-ACP--UDP-N-acetylglucosamine O-acyltransferase [Thermoanaerobaculum sp.]